MNGRKELVMEECNGFKKETTRKTKHVRIVSLPDGAKKNLGVKRVYKTKLDENGVINTCKM